MKPNLLVELLQLFRALFPSWKFFDDVTQAPTLSYLLYLDDVPVGDWVQALRNPGKRRLINLFYNAHENFLFAGHSLLGRLRDELQLHADSSVSLDLIQNLVRYELFQMPLPDSADRKLTFQFRVMIDEDTLHLSDKIEVVK